jgi:hypothetical protein
VSSPPLFDSGGLWKVFPRGRKLLYVLKEPIPEAQPYGALLVDRTWRHGALYGGDGRTRGAPIPFPLDELLFQHHLAFHGGLELHASGVVLGGKSVLFVGDSGAGKTTLARLYERYARGTPILSDDRIAVCRKRGRFSGFGTPWHGSGRFASPEGRPLGAIFFLSHAELTQAERLGPTDCAGRLFARAFVPRWDKGVVGRALEVCGEVANEIPSYDLRVLPGKAVLGAVAQALDEGGGGRRPSAARNGHNRGARGSRGGRGPRGR